MFVLLKLCFAPSSPVVVSFDGWPDDWAIIVRPTARPSTVLPHYDRRFIVALGLPGARAFNTKRLFLINAATGRIDGELHARTAFRHHGFSPDGKLIAIEESIEGVPNASTGEKKPEENSLSLRIGTGHGEQTLPLTSAPTHSVHSVTVHAWDPVSGATSERLLKSRPFPLGNQEQQEVVVSADFTTLVLLATEEKTIRFERFDLRTGERESELTIHRDLSQQDQNIETSQPGVILGWGDPHPRLQLALSADAQHLALWGHSFRVEVFDLESGETVTTLDEITLPNAPEEPPLQPHSEWSPYWLDFSPDGEHLVVWLREFADGGPHRRLNARSVAYSLSKSRWELRELLPRGPFAPRVFAVEDIDWPEPFWPQTLYSDDGKTALIVTGAPSDWRIQLHSSTGEALAAKVAIPPAGDNEQHADLKMYGEDQAILVTSIVDETELLDWVPGLERDHAQAEEPIDGHRFSHFKLRLIDLKTGRLRSIGTFDGPSFTADAIASPNSVGVLLNDKFVTVRTLQQPATWPGPVCVALGVVLFAVLIFVDEWTRSDGNWSHSEQ